MRLQPKREYRMPRAGEVDAYLSTHARSVERGEGQNLRFSPCPHCKRDQPGHKSNTVHKVTGLGYCWACDTSSNWFTLTRAFGDPLPVDDRFLRPPGSDRRRIDMGSMAMQTAKPRRPVIGGHYPELLSYCRARGFTDETLDAWRVSTKGPKVLRWPIFARDEDGWQAVNARLRVCLGRDEARTKDWFEVTGGETGLLLGNHLLDLEDKSKIAVICEGQWDAMTAWQLGFKNSFSLPNGANHIDVARMLQFLPDDWEVWLAVDMDKQGDLAAEAFFAALGPDRCARLYLPHKDLNAWLMAKPDLSMAEIKTTLRGLTPKAKIPDQAGGIMKLSRQSKVAPEQPLISTPWPRLNEILSGGLYASQTTGVLAPSGMGKSTLVNQLAIHAASKGVRTTLFSFEETREKLQVKLTNAIDGYIGEAFFESVSSNLDISKCEGSNVGRAVLLEELDTFIQRGCKLVIIDNLDFIMPRTDPGQREKHKLYANLVDIARANRLHIVVVWQPNKIDRAQLVNSGNQKGASQMLQDADNYINLNMFDNDYKRLEVEKSRVDGVGADNHVWLKYDSSSRCYIQVVSPRVGSLGPKTFS